MYKKICYAQNEEENIAFRWWFLFIYYLVVVVKKASSKRFIKHSFKILSCQTSCSICLVFYIEKPQNYVQEKKTKNK